MLKIAARHSATVSEREPGLVSRARQQADFEFLQGFIRILRLLFPLIAALSTAPASRAQSSETGVGEVYGYVGAMTGLGTNPAGGLGLGVATSERIVVLGEAAFSPISTASVEPRGLIRSRLYAFSGLVHIRFPVSVHFAPYALAGAGVLRLTTRHATTTSAGQFRTVGSEDTFTFQTGAGFRYYLTERWGLRPELRVYAGQRFIGALSAGIFYQFP